MLCEERFPYAQTSSSDYSHKIAITSQYPRICCRVHRLQARGGLLRRQAIIEGVHQDWLNNQSFCFPAGDDYNREVIVLV
jgi:hypothetical protein